MNKTAIKNFSVWARVSLIESVKQKAFEYEITEDTTPVCGLNAVSSRLLSNTERAERDKLIAEIGAKGYSQVMEEVAYTWFNRFIALRYMEVNGFLPSRVRVFSDEEGSFKPEILKEALTLELDGLDKERVYELLDKQDNEALYKYLIITQCNALGSSLPGMFERLSDYTELLFPNNLLHEDSVIGKMVTEIAEDEWKDAVQIIGWMYQYYISQKHEEIINIYKGTIKKEDIPAATQLFTTDWVVRYMIDNSLGKYWIERNPSSALASKLEFLITPKDGKINYVDEHIEPTELTVFDPCMGSGHILVYAFDVLMEIYRECGYSDRDAARSIVENNLYGLDIDKRAYQLAYFAILMRARSYNRRILTEDIIINLSYTEESNNIDEFYCEGITDNEEENKIGEYLVKVYKDAKEIGTLQTVEPYDYDAFDMYLNSIGNDKAQQDIFFANWSSDVLPIVKALSKQAKIMSKKYAVVCTNPPYMNKLEGALKKFITTNYKDYSGDMFSVFIYRNFDYCMQNGYSAFMTPFVWMFIKTYEKLRSYIINNKNISSIIQMEYSAFEEATVPICTFVLKNSKTNNKTLGIKLSDFKGGMEVQKQKVLEAISNKNCGYLYETSEDNFTKIPGSPIAYWVSDRLLDGFKENKISSVSDVQEGLKTGDNERFIREWFEVSFEKTSLKNGFNAKWVFHTKGGDYRKWYGNQNEVINFENNGEELKKFKGASLTGASNYFKENISYSRITSAKTSFRYTNEGSIPNMAGLAIYPFRNLWYMLGWLNTNVVYEMLCISNPTINFPPGTIGRIPIKVEKTLIEEVEVTSKKNYDISKTDWDSFETSWDFKKHPLV